MHLRTAVLLLAASVAMVLGHTAPSAVPSIRLDASLLDSVTVDHLQQMGEPRRGVALGEPGIAQLVLMQSRDDFLAERDLELAASVKEAGAGARTSAVWIALVGASPSSSGDSSDTGGVAVVVAFGSVGSQAEYDSFVHRRCASPPSTKTVHCFAHRYYADAKAAVVVSPLGIERVAVEVVSAGGFSTSEAAAVAFRPNQYNTDGTPAPTTDFIAGRKCDFQWPAVIASETEEGLNAAFRIHRDVRLADADDEDIAPEDNLTFEWELYHETELDTDFSSLSHAMPAHVYVGQNEADILTALYNATTTGTKLRVRGAGHSMNGQTISKESVLLIKHSPPRFRLFSDGLLEVSAGSLLYDIQEVLEAHGRQLAVNPDYMFMTVGGYLSVGGYGVNSVRNGMFGDHVERVRLILPKNGTAVWCSKEEHHELFSFVVGGLGHVGIVDTVVIRTVPSMPVSVVVTKSYESVADLAASMKWLALPATKGALVTGFRGWVELHMQRGLQRKNRNGTYRVQADAVYSMEVGSKDDAFDMSPHFVSEVNAATASVPVGRITQPKKRMLPREWAQIHHEIAEWTAKYPDSLRLWTDFLFPYPAFIQFMSWLETTLLPSAAESNNKGNLVTVYLLAVRRSEESPHFFPLEASSSAEHGPDMTRFLVGIYFMPLNDPERVDEAKRLARLAKEKALELGGKPYMYSWQDLTPQDCLRAYGAEDLARFRAVLELTDPYGAIDIAPHMAPCLTALPGSVPAAVPTPEPEVV